jgi:starch phosphorylase
LVSSARERLARQLARAGVVAGGESAAARLDPEALTLGFARRFAEYKRPHLLLTDPDRLARILTNRDRPAQLVVAGKAHPADEGGKRLIEAWVEFARRPDVRERVVFLEDYDIALAEELTQGVDVWVNTPRRPMEACGTSGMKVLVNGGLNLSERDGWWAEADDADVGWGLGGADDGAEARLLYETLEQRIIPEFYERDPHGIPRRWLGRIRASMSRLAPRFSANRMLREYLDDLYVPAAMAVRRRTKDGARIARELTAVRARLQAGWGDVVLETVEVSRDGNAWRFRVAATLGAVPVEAVRCHICADPVNDAQAVREPLTPAGRDERGRLRFEGRVASARSASDFTPRLVAWHADAFCPSDLPFIRWPQ